MVRLQKESFPVMDIIKFIFCFFIVGIHTETFVENAEVHYWIEKGLFRLAVPYFVLCSGFLLAMKIDMGKDIYTCIKHFSDRLTRLLLVFEPISIIFMFVIFTLEGRSIFYILLRVIQSIIFYPYGALWYIQAMIIGIWFLYFKVLKKKKERLGYCVGIPLFLFALICNSYFFLIDNSAIGEYVNLYLKIAVSARNGIFYGFFVLWIGFLSYKLYKKKLIPDKVVTVLFFVCYILYLIELFGLKEKTLRDDGSIFIMSIPVTFCLLLLSVRWKEKSNKTVVLRNLSTGIYLLHRPVLYALTIIQMWFSIEISYGLRFIIVSGITVLICSFSYKKNYLIAQFLK